FYFYSHNEKGGEKMNRQEIVEKVLSVSIRVAVMSVTMSAVIAVSAVMAFAGGYTLTYLGTNFEPMGINNSGQVVGFITTPSGDYHSALFSNGTITDLGTLPGYSESYARGINNSGQIVGYSFNFGGAQYATLYSNGTVTNLGTLGGITSA